MRFNFKKVSAIATSALMMGMTMGVAAAATYPAPFVSGSTADVAIVYGSNALLTDVVEASSIQLDLQNRLTGTTTDTDASITGEAISLDTGSTRIWLNTSLNAAKTTLTKTDLPTVLADYSFSGNVDSKLTSTIKLQAGGTAGGDNSGKVIFARQPKSSSDPVVGISIGSSETSNPLYNASVTMTAVNFSHADSEGEEVVLFGQKFTISADTDTSKIVLLKEAQRLTLDSDNPSASVTIGGATYTVELISSSDSDATIKVTDSTGASNSKSINEADSKKIQGLEVGVVTADETNLKLSATIIAGAEKVTFESGTTITKGDDNDPVDGTFVYIVGGTGATTEIAVAVFRPDSSSDAILEGESFTDPAFGSFKIDFAGLSSPLDSTAREAITIQNSADDTMTITMTDDGGNSKTFDFAHNQSGGLYLGDDSNFSINVREMANLSEDEYIVVGTEDYGHLLSVVRIYNNTGTDYTQDSVDFQDVISGDSYESTFTSEGTGSLDVDGKRYTVTFRNSGSDGWATLKYPTADSADANTAIVFPTIKTKNGAQVAFYEPLTIDLDSFDGGGNDLTTLKFPDGDSYSSITFAYYGNGDLWNITHASTEALNTTLAGVNSVDFVIGEFEYNITEIGANLTQLYLVDPETTTSNIDQPAVMIIEGKDDNTEYHSIVVDLETPAATSTDGLGVSDVLFSSDYYHASASLQSNSDLTKDIDWWGAVVSTDASDSDQKIATISYPSSQVYSQIYLGEEAAAITPGVSGGGGSNTPLGEVLVTDAEISSVATKNLIVVGGSCINSAAATLVEGAFCGSAWTEKTGVGSGQFLIKGYATNSLTSKLALLVAGYNAADTVNAAKYLRTKTVDTSLAYKGTSATTAELITEAAA